MRIDRIDHLVLTVAEIDRTIAFYVGVLGMTHTTFRSDRKALTFGSTRSTFTSAAANMNPRHSLRHPAVLMCD